jgi:hypothetical protein
MFFYVENLKNIHTYRQNLLKLLKILVKVVKYKISKQKPMLFFTLAMNNLKMKIKDCIIHNSTKNNEILRNKFIKVVQDLYTENYPTY